MPYSAPFRALFIALSALYVYVITLIYPCQEKSAADAADKSIIYKEIS